MTTVVNIPLKNYPAYLQRLGSRFIPAARRGVLHGAMRAIPTLHRATSKAPPANPGMVGTGGAVNTGRYLRSWFAEATQEGAVLYNSAPYSPIIEHGRRRGKFPPVRELELWVIRRLGVKPDEAKGVAFVIARAIARRGLLGRKVMTNAMPAIVEGLGKSIEYELKRELTRP